MDDVNAISSNLKRIPFLVGAKCALVGPAGHSESESVEFGIAESVANGSRKSVFGSKRDSSQFPQILSLRTHDFMHYYHDLSFPA